jgi:tetratricopeptide (TPR) repeat protein
MLASIRRRLARARIGLYMRRGVRARIQARYGEAEGSLVQARMLAEASFGQGSGETIEPLNQLGILYKYAGRFDDAERSYRCALTRLDGLSDQALRAALLHNLAGLAHARGRFDEAETIARAGLAHRIGARAAALDIAADEAALGSILAANGQSVEAEALIRKSMATFESRLGPEHYEVAANLNNLAALLFHRGDVAAAAPMYRRALAIKERRLGMRHPEVALILNNLAVLERERGDRGAACAYADRAVAIARESLPAGHQWRDGCEANQRAISGESEPQRFASGPDLSVLTE